MHWVQLHAYQTPGLVRAVKGISPDVRVIKVLHVRGGECIEERLIGAYEKAGVDVFLFDAVSEDGRVGSTGQTLDPELVASLAEGLDAAVPARRRHLGREPGRSSPPSPPTRATSGSTSTPTRAGRTAR